MDEEMRSLIKKRIRKFPWGNYGLDDMEQLDSDEWAEALADDIISALDSWEH